MSFEHAAHSSDASADHATLHGIPAHIDDAQRVQLRRDKNEFRKFTIYILTELAKRHHSDIDKSCLTTYPRSSGQASPDPNSDGPGETDSRSGPPTDEAAGAAAKPRITTEYPADSDSSIHASTFQEDLQYCISIGAKVIGSLWGWLCVLTVRTTPIQYMDITYRGGCSLFNSLHRKWVVYLEGAAEPSATNPPPIRSEDGAHRREGALQREEDPRPVVIHAADPQATLRRRRPVSHRSAIPAAKLEEVAVKLENLWEATPMAPFALDRATTPPPNREDCEQYQEQDFTLVILSASGHVTFKAEDFEGPPPRRSPNAQGEQSATVPMAYTGRPRATSALPTIPSASAGPSRVTDLEQSHDRLIQLQEDVNNAETEVKKAKVRRAYARGRWNVGKGSLEKLQLAECDLASCEERLEKARIRLRGPKVEADDNSE
ncbi:hypothetical protein D9611_013096 [Ephemerocybe angulata]|uniref:Uncharacterized protein n=1 Tax=Ephemerocybe angulata TaxID=980116 RepID=A0A8H5BXZ4_9AGAR|nr:hypothetical protein D9611_013096 [Tulosesus angulatus]